MTNRIFIPIGGGESRNRTTAPIDGYISNLAKTRAAEGKRPYALFFPTASHDSNPYFNSFRKTYTSLFDVKADVAILTKGLMTVEHVEEKIDKADILYFGGGDTLFLMRVLEETGIKEKVLAAYRRGAILTGLSAGAICWFEDIYTDSVVEGEFMPAKGYGVFSGAATPHYNLRREFDGVREKEGYSLSYAIEDNAALVFENENLIGALSSGGSAFVIDGDGRKEEVALIGERADDSRQ